MCGIWKMREKSSPFAFQCSMPLRMSRRSVRPISSTRVRTPSDAMISRNSSATKKKKFTTCFRLSLEFLRSSGSCVATPTGQVFRWHLRIMMQPVTTSGAVGESKFVGAENRADCNIAAGLHLAIHLHCDAAAQLVQHQRLLGFRKAKFPGRAGMLDRRPGRSAGTAIVPGDGDVIGLCLGYAGRDGADAVLGNQLDADRRFRIGVFQVVYQLRQIFDRIDVVMRRRRYQAYARNREPQFRDVFGNLVAGQLPALARLGAPAPS